MSTALLNRLEANLEKYTRQFDELVDDFQFRNIAFGAAGYLNKASKNKLYSQRGRIGVICDKIQLTRLCIRIVKGEPFNYMDIRGIYTSFLADRSPEMSSEFETECFRLYAVKVMINMIFEVYQVPYRKSIVKYKLKYCNGGGNIIDIPLS